MFFEGYKVNAFRYLKKPMEQEKLWEALLSAVSKLEKEYEIELWDEEGLHIVRPKDIIYVETSGRNVIVRTVEKDYCVKMGITQFAENLNGTVLYLHTSLIMLTCVISRSSINRKQF